MSNPLSCNEPPLLDKPRFWQCQTCIDLLVVTGVVVLIFCFYGYPSLFTPDEGRYAEIAREMLASHQYIVPHLNGVIYFEKPPLGYWLTALMLHLFGYSEWSARLIDPMFSLLGVWFTYFACYRLYTRRVAFIAAIVVSTATLYVAMGRMLTLDIGLAFFVNVSLLSFLMGLQCLPGRKKTGWFWFAYAMAGAAMMYKGWIGLVFPVMIIGLWVLILNQWQQVRHMRIISGLLIFAIIAFPWIIAVAQRHPNFAYYYLFEQQFARYATDIAGRHMSIFSYIGLFLIGLLPWTSYLPQAITRIFKQKQAHQQHYRCDMFLLIWGVTITLFFGFSKSILIPYLLPIIVPFSIVVARYFDHVLTQPFTGGLRISAWCNLLLNATMIIAFLVLPFCFYSSIKQLMLPFFTAAILLTFNLVFAIDAFKRNSLKRLIASMVVLAIVWGNAAWVGGPYINQRSVKPLALTINTLLTEHPDMLVADYGYPQDLPYYIQRKVLIVDWQSELAYGYKHQPSATQWMISTEQFKHLWGTKPHVVVVLGYGDYQRVFVSQQLAGHVLQKTFKALLVSNFPVEEISA